MPDCNKYKGGNLPPCAALLGNRDPIIKDGRIIFRNQNRLFFFIGTASPKGARYSIDTNVQITLSTFIIGLFIDQIEHNSAKYKNTIKIHARDDINTFIHNSLSKPLKVSFKYKPSLSLVYSNADAILHPFLYTLRISPNNYLILLAINRFENNPGLFFINNSHITEDVLNFILAGIDISAPECNNKKSGMR